MALPLHTRLLRTYGLLKTFGLRYRCPLCGWRAHRFYAAGFSFPVLARYQVISAGKRENIRCPRCRSSSRERLMYLFLQRHLPAFGSGKVLHVAPEPQLGALLRRLYGDRYVSLDIDAARADVVADIIDIPFEDSSFELVICAHVLEHVPDDRRAMREFARILTPTGTAILLVPFSPLLSESSEDPTVTTPEAREEVFGQSDHVRIYGTDYPARLRESGLAVDVRLPATIVAEDEIDRFALDAKEPLFVCRKAQS